MSKSSVWRIVHGRRTENLRQPKAERGKCGRQKMLTSRGGRKFSTLLIMLREKNLKKTQRHSTD